MPKAKKEKAVKKVGSAKAPKLDYHLEVSFNDTVYKGDAISLDQALADFVNSSVFPQGVKTKVIMRFGNKSREEMRILQPVLARRLFNKISLKPVAREILAGKLSTQLA